MGRVKRGQFRLTQPQGLCPETRCERGGERALADLHSGDARGPIGKAQAVEQRGLGLVDDPAAYGVQGLRPGADDAYHVLPSGEACGEEK